ncbi:MAG TPA: hypothetical protein DCZ71_08395, partial [Ruminococcus sp.]|nr:hypothetical protein [Ruminococcus sp.]
ENAVWAFDSDSGILYIYGSGPTNDYGARDNLAPWAQPDENGNTLLDSITEVRFDSHITSVGNNFLNGAENLRRIALPEDLVRIGTSAFNGAGSLERVVIPAKVTEIGASAFQKCDNLNAFIMDGSLPEITGAVIASQKRITSTKNLTVYYHASDPTWADFTASGGSSLGFHSSTVLKDLDKESVSDKIILKNAPDKIAVGDEVRVGVELDPRIATEFIWESSSPDIIQVSAAGDITAFSAGIASITVRAAGAEDISASFMVSASDEKGYSSRQPESRILDGAVSNNISNNDYSAPFPNPLTSHIMQREDGGLTIIECKNTGGRDDALIQEYDTDNKLIRSLVIENPFDAPSFFIGFCDATKYNFLVFTQNNDEEDDEKEIIRIIRYNKDWTEPMECRIKDIGATSVGYKQARMVEADKYLYFVSNRLEYFSLYPGEIAQHQSNLVYAIDMETMERDEAGIAALVSHSFNQFIAIDDDYVYTADHGDISPRSIVEYRFNNNVSSTTNLRSATALDIVVKGHGQHQNDTGVSIGGLEATGSGCILVGNSVIQSPETETSAQRNIFVSVTNRAFTDVKQVWLTDYPEGSSITPRTPQIVKVSSNVYTVMWEEKNNDTGSIVTKYTAIDQYGNPLTEIKTTDLRLSDCQPIVTKEGNVVWYVTENSKPILYQVNPYSSENIQINDVKYDFDEETGTLVVSGKGIIPDHSKPEDRPYEEYKDQIKKVIVEGEIYTIGENAFSEMGSVKEIYVESDTYDIKKNAFSGNKELEVLVLPDNLNSMGSGALTGDDKLELVVLPDTIENVDLGEIYYKPFTDVYYEGTQEKWDELTKDLYDETKAQKDIKTGVKSGQCGETAYWVYDPETKELEVYGSGEIDTKPDQEYSWSSLADQVERLDLQEGITNIPDKAFADFTKLETAVIPDTVEKIGSGAFAGNTSSDHIIIPDSVKEVDSNAFGTDSSMNPREDFTVYAPKDSPAEKYAEEKGVTFTEIDGKCGEDLAYRFDEETGKLTIVGTGDMYNYKQDELPPWNEYADKITEVELPDDITRLGDYSFWGLTKLEEITIPESVKEVGRFAVSNDPSLRDINIETTDFTEEFGSFFNNYGRERNINFSGTQEQWDNMEHNYFSEETDTITVNYVKPPEPIVTTSGTTEPGQETTTTASGSDESGQQTTSEDNNPGNPTVTTSEGDNPGTPTET